MWECLPYCNTLESMTNKKVHKLLKSLWTYALIASEGYASAGASSAGASEVVSSAACAASASACAATAAAFLSATFLAIASLTFFSASRFLSSSQPFFASVTFFSTASCSCNLSLLPSIKTSAGMQPSSNAPFLTPPRRCFIM